MSTNNLLIELGTAELPPKALRTLAQSFAEHFESELSKAELGFGTVRWLASPRRLALLISDVDSAQQDKQVEKRGPSVQAAFDADGNPTKAALGWARGNGITIEQAQRITTDKGEWLLHIANVRGKSVVELVPELTQAALARLPIPKPMRWGDSDAEFIRPVQTLTLMYGAEVIPATILGRSSDNKVQGHRFHSKGLLTLKHANEYEQLLENEGKVIADFEKRKQMIQAQVEAAALAEGGVADIDDALLDEVTALVELPVTMVGGFATKFLEVPAEALIYSMKDNQKYFPVLDKHGKLMNRFVFVSNVASADPAVVISGNEKVIRPRLADAEFFFNTDKKKTLASRIDSLDTVLFQQQLGTLKDKVERISQLASHIAKQIDANPEDAARAGLLSKTDLMSEMVMEFPDVQGVMGMYYARHDGESEAVANALQEQYLPRFAGDSLPQSKVGAAVALADKFDTLAGIFGIGQIPKGDKDPFALRRAAIGALRIITELELPLDLAELTGFAVTLYGDKLSNQATVEQVVEFLLGRFRTAYQDAGFSVDTIQAVLARRPTRPVDFDRRVKAVSAFRELEAADALAAANKRVGNILAKAETIQQGIDPALLSESAEIALSEQVSTLSQQLQPLFADGSYAEALTQLANLRPAIDTFFDQVMVMADDAAVKANRLALLNALRNLFLEVADISLLQS